MPKFEVDQVVYAKWPGSSQYFKATILSLEGDGDWEVKFDSDETVSTVPGKNIMTESAVNRASRSPSRRPRSRSPSRRRSRSRSPSRKKKTSASPTASPTASPVARQPRSPARVSRRKKSQEEEEVQSPEEEKKSPKAVKRVKSERSAAIKVMKSLDALKTANVEEINTHEFSSSTTTRSGGRATQEQTSVTRRTTRSVTRAIQQDQPEEQVQKCSLSGPCNVAKKVTCVFKTLACVAGSLIAMTLPVIFLYGLYLSCKSKKSCTFLAWPVIPDCKKFFNWKSTGYMFGWYLFQLGLSSLPLGKMVTGPVLASGKRQTHCLNGCSQFFISMATVGGLVYYGKLPYKYLTVNYLSLITASALYSVIISVVIFLLSRKASSKEPSNGLFNDFLQGRITSPVVCPYVNLKLYAFKTGNISWCLMNLVYSIGTLRKDWKANISLVLLLTMQTIYVLDKFCSQEAQLHTACLKSAKVGYFTMVCSFVVFPFLLSLQTRYLVMFPVNLPSIYYIVPIIITVAGFMILVQSRTQKFMFRKDKHDAILKGWNYLPTRNGKGLLCDGWWSQLRHPNYFGDIIQAVGWVLVCGTQHFLPWTNIVLRLPMFIGRVEEDGAYCSKQYGSTWKEYENKVKKPFRSGNQCIALMSPARFAQLECSHGIFLALFAGQARFSCDTLLRFARIYQQGVLNLCYLIKEMSAGRDVVKTNPSFVLLLAFQLWYILDIVFFEESFLYTATLSKDKFGYFQLIGMLTVFPFFCCLQARFLVSFPLALSWNYYVVPCLLHVVGYYIYRTSHFQKILFKKDFQKAKEMGVKFIPTKSGTNILVDGFWGTLRRPNYTGDYMMLLGWSLLCGCSHLLPWFWAIMNVFVFVAMVQNDENRCAKKYGDSWKEYTERVKYRLIPYVY